LEITFAVFSMHDQLHQLEIEYKNNWIIN
jgi:hypothetical protein